MKEIVFISGKGGTGKTSITAAFAMLGKKDVIVADCDVDAADMHLLLRPDFAKSESFYSGELAIIDSEKCTNCGECASVCQFNAVSVNKGQHIINPLDCEGCGYCARICPADAITNETVNVGNWYVSTIKTGSIMVHARLGIGADNSGKLVAKVKNETHQIAQKNGQGIILVDGSPGIGCPVISSLAGANFVVLVTEPTLSGIHDLKRVYELVAKFGIRAGCIINKSDLNPSISKEILTFLEENQIAEIATIPYDDTFSKAMSQGKTIIEAEDNIIKEILIKSWEKIQQLQN